VTGNDVGENQCAAAGGRLLLPPLPSSKSSGERGDEGDGRRSGNTSANDSSRGLSVYDTIEPRRRPCCFSPFSGSALCCAKGPPVSVLHAWPAVFRRVGRDALHQNRAVQPLRGERAWWVISAIADATAHLPHSGCRKPEPAEMSRFREIADRGKAQRHKPSSRLPIPREHERKENSVPVARVGD